ncbi:hypothetical protein Nhal_1126 [Nitrosococcus halophilus Nc 4]|uniref:Uncharacterized protein n=1 Tax=Nitrosococcus halophilus (strain Nc4) TaxID=472759 RepID=D5BZK0_NITHN|nr:hypothetical protein [Nitrosococcus halophilus]ADE14295.1 hypothetical protein Nhal_1126 [Nitrosococcus halophilus Nc 4]
MEKEGSPTFKQRCKQVIHEARELNPNSEAMIGCLAARLVMTQNAMTLHIQRMKKLLQDMEADLCQPKPETKESNGSSPRD